MKNVLKISNWVMFVLMTIGLVYDASTGTATTTIWVVGIWVVAQNILTLLYIAQNERVDKVITDMYAREELKAEIKAEMKA